ncbi:hypothetical protein ACIOUE_05280 [Streptomyces xanthochromogenes]|uniref:hypothetical protein n=1 Tax=Streptomyces xanthochromogenes TaxID=67384 RepID=UPI00144EDB0E|nr:hypothetical protein [Streptomyces sp. SID1034]
MTGRETDLKSQRRWADKWWVVGLWALVVGVAIRLLFRGLADWVAIVAASAFYAIVFTAMTRRRQQSDARATGLETDDVPVLERRIRRGTVPDDPALRQSMLRLVRRRLKLMHSKVKWVFPAMMVVFVGLGVLFLVHGGVVAGVVSMLCGAGFVGGMWWMRRTNIGRYQRMERQLTQRPESRPAMSPRQDEEQAA